MKKLLTILLSLVMLTSLASAFALVTSAEEEAAAPSAKFYQVEADTAWLYVVFSEDMADPVDADMVALCLIGHGWPVNDDAGNKIYRHLVRTEFSAVEVITPRVWRFSHRGSKTDAAKTEHVQWFMVNCPNAETAPAEVQDWTARLFGTIRTAAGEDFPLSEDPAILDMNGMEIYGPAYNLGELKDINKVATIFDLGVDMPTEEDTETDPPAATTPEQTTDKPTDTTADTTTAEQTDKPADSTDKPADAEGGNALIPIIAAIAAVVVIVVVVVVVVKKRKA